MTGILDLLQRYRGSSANDAPAGVSEDFDTVAAGAERGHLAGGLGHAFQSDQTPPFEQMVEKLFGASNGEQKAGIVNQLLGSLGPNLLNSGSLAGLLKSFDPSDRSEPVTPEQAGQVPPEAVRDLAKTAKEHDPSIVERASSFYAQHPTLLKALGTGALALILSHMSNPRA